MEVKMNKEIRDYTESMFFGLSLRQFAFSICACGVAVGLYFLLRPHVGMETVSWVCILGAFPFAAMGFIKYNGLTAERLIWVWFKSEFLIPKRLVCKPENLYFEALKPFYAAQQKGADGAITIIFRKIKKFGQHLLLRYLGGHKNKKEQR